MLKCQAEEAPAQHERGPRKSPARCLRQALLHNWRRCLKTAAPLVGLSAIDRYTGAHINTDTVFRLVITMSKFRVSKSGQEHHAVCKVHGSGYALSHRHSARRINHHGMDTWAVKIHPLEEEIRR